MELTRSMPLHPTSSKIASPRFLPTVPIALRKYLGKLVFNHYIRYSNLASSHAGRASWIVLVLDFGGGAVRRRRLVARLSKKLGWHPVFLLIRFLLFARSLNDSILWGIYRFWWMVKCFLRLPSIEGDTTLRE